ncbi:MAG: glycoside hydrolase domain-containing protein, partial [bacterium]
DLALSVSYLGGMVVYVNGRELTRRHLPDGELEPTTPAADYPERAFFDEKGSLWRWTSYRTDAAGRKAFELRLRRLSVRVPASMLRKGVNVVALENHRSPAPEGFFLGENKKYRNIKHVKAFCWWSRVGVRAVRLTAAKGAAATPNAAHTGRPKGVQVWTWPTHRMVSARDYADPCEPLHPVRLCGARNGAYSGQVVIGSGRAIRGLEVEVSALKGPAVLPASAVEVRYPLCSVAARRGRGPFFDGLEDFAPANVPVRKGEEGDPIYGAVQPIWLTARIPADAKPGRYSGTVTVRARGIEPVEVPLTLEIVDWTLPDPTEFFTHLGLIESPDSLAMWYDVPMWSEAHWKLLDRTFGLLGAVGTRVIWITAQRKTHFGNEHAMIRWSRAADGELEPDLSIAERYLGVAVKHLGTAPIVAVYAWRAPWSVGHFGHHKAQDHKILISVVDPDTGELEKAEGPDWGRPECARFWRPVFAGMKDLVKRRGIPEASLMIGTAGDYEPSDEALADLAAASGGLRWASHSHVIHHALGSKRTHRTGYIAAGWGGHCHHVDPEFGRGYGWKNPFLRVVTRNAGTGVPSPSRTTWHRFYLEYLLTGRIMPKQGSDRPDYGLRGLGRVGADFWPVLGERRLPRPAKADADETLDGRYPETAWGQLSLRCCGRSMLAPGRDGAIMTVALELFRENLQEIEARVFIEKALHDPGRRAKLGEELAARALEILDERVRLCNRSGRYRGTLASGLAGRPAALYELAARVSRKLAQGSSKGR